MVFRATDRQPRGGERCLRKVSWSCMPIGEVFGQHLLCQLVVKGVQAAVIAIVAPEAFR